MIANRNSARQPVKQLLRVLLSASVAFAIANPNTLASVAFAIANPNTLASVAVCDR
ncbi:MAG TPA: hypothetical protein V6C90_12440 [Coleofasciculaceae cyanobacterium]